MSIQLEFTWLVGVALTVLAAFWALAKLLLAQNQKHMDAQFKVMGDTLKAQDEGTRRIERDLMELKAELPRDYVRREDHNRVIGGVTVSIDNLRLTLERYVMLKGGKP